MKSKLKIIIPIIIAIAAVIIAAMCISFTPEKSADPDALMATAQNYLSKQDYEQAIAEFKMAIELDPMNVDAYPGLAQAYIAIGDKESAVEWLEKGYELTGDERIKAMLDGLLEHKEETTVTTTALLTETEATTEMTGPAIIVPKIDELDRDGIEKALSEADIEYTIIEEYSDDVPAGKIISHNIPDDGKISNDFIIELVISLGPKIDENTVKDKALAVIDKFDNYKSTGEPNSQVYYYRSEGKTGTLTKCVYDSSGELVTLYTNTYRADTKDCNGEVIVNNWKDNTSEFYRYGILDGTKICDAKCFLNYIYLSTAYDTFNRDCYSIVEFDNMTDNCYTYSLNKTYFPADVDQDIELKITVDGKNDPVKIVQTETYSGFSSVYEFTLNNNEWICHYSNYSSDGVSVDFFPCVNTFPEGASEKDLEIPLVDSDDCKVFFDWSEYNAYR